MLRQIRISTASHQAESRGYFCFCSNPLARCGAGHESLRNLVVVCLIVVEAYHGPLVAVRAWLAFGAVGALTLS